MHDVTRRSLLKHGITITGLTALSPYAASAVLTPRATEGPFYPRQSMRFDDVDNDLVKVLGTLKKAGGDIIHLQGTIRSKAGQPLAGHRIEIWQCDVNGKYLHPGDNRNFPYDTGFQGFGHDITDAEGAYHFRTIKPTTYPGRTPHIHVKVFDGQRELLTTQFYIADEPQNKSDRIFRRLSAQEAQSVSMVFVEDKGTVTTNVDLVI